MARGTTLIRLIDMLRAEIKASLNPAHNRQARDHHVAQLQQAQNDLWEDYEWPFLRIERTMQLRAGVHIYDLPDDIGLDAIQALDLRDGGRWRPLINKIDQGHYSVFDSSLDERSWPVTNWQIAEGDKIEFWPMPDQTGNDSDKEGYVKFTAKQKLSPLVDDDHRATLDDRLIVLYAAMHFLSKDDLKKTSDKFKKRLSDVRGNMASSESFKIFGTGEPRRKLQGPPSVHYRVNET